MPYPLQEVAAISGLPGLYRLVKAARQGVLVESLDEKRTRSMASARNKVSLLNEISIYTADYDVTVPLGEVFDRLHQHYGSELPVTGKSSEAELADFLAGVIPDYDRQRVYTSDIRKLAAWYSLISKHLPYQEAPAGTSATEEEAGGNNAAEPAAEPLSTGGAIGELEAGPTATGNPEAAAPAKKSRKKAE